MHKIRFKWDSSYHRVFQSIIERGDHCIKCQQLEQLAQNALPNKQNQTNTRQSESNNRCIHVYQGRQWWQTYNVNITHSAKVALSGGLRFVSSLPATGGVLVDRKNALLTNLTEKNFYLLKHNLQKLLLLYKY